MTPDKRTLVPCGVSRHRRTALRLLLRRCREVPGSMHELHCSRLLRRGVLLFLRAGGLSHPCQPPSPTRPTTCRLSLPSLSFVLGYSPSLKKTKTPPVSKTDKPEYMGKAQVLLVHPMENPEEKMTKPKA